jgi:hypothetical protein
MSMEIRYISFTKEETQNAIIGYVLKQGLALSNEIIGLKVNGGIEGEVAATVRLRHPTTEREIKIEGDDLISYLILLRNRSRIPIPRNAQKRIESSSDGITLVMTTDLGVGDKLPNVLGNRVTYNAMTNALQEANFAKHAVVDALRQTAISDTIAAEAIAKMQIADIASTRAKAQLREIAKVVGVRGRIGRWLLKFNFQP